MCVQCVGGFRGVLLFTVYTAQSMLFTVGMCFCLVSAVCEPSSSAAIEQHMLHIARYVALASKTNNPLKLSLDPDLPRL